MALADTQRAIWRWVTAPEGVAAALADPQSEVGTDPRATLDAIIRSSDALGAIDRLEVYANAYFYRIAGVLEDAFPMLASQLGSEVFHDLVTSYLLVYPPIDPSLRTVGNRLPDFLAEHEVAASFRCDAPWASDLARFEVFRADVFDALDTPLLSPTSVADIAPREFAELPLSLAPTVRICALEFPVDRCLEGSRSKASTPPTPASVDARSAAAPDLSPLPTRLLIWRSREKVCTRSLDAEEFQALEATRGGTYFDALCELAADLQGDDAAPALAAGWLGQWLNDGILIAPAP